MMKNLQKIGGIAALIGAATNFLAIVMFIILAPQGYGSDDPGQAVAFFAGTQTFMHLLYQIQYLLFGVSLIFLTLALSERLKAGSPVLTQAVTTFGLLWAFLVIVIGTLAINNLNTIVKLYGDSPAQAATVWLTLNAMESGLGGGGGETIVNAVWLLLLGWAAWRVSEFPRMLNYLGVGIGVAGIVSVVLASLGLMVVYGLGLILWLAWLGIVLLLRPANIVQESNPKADLAREVVALQPRVAADVAPLRP